ncbi:MAG: hypothetical protein JO256_08690 [Alphaproteobacteria bacterium]|nr:hypothetical protein [Alphaproteobacteria bacterium]
MTITPRLFLIGLATVFVGFGQTMVPSFAAENPAQEKATSANIGEIAPQVIALYQKQMRAAMAITDPPRRDAAVMNAREQLAQNVGKPMTAATIANLDGILDIGGVSPQLGATA